ncbi:hypothetical protein ZIOFF_035156 [Zingiber officinale]|uniref:Pentatricopeptide repeat-containing protein n=1 Tax=Zingiber officinale TaxID=94328 RepID=A0A8J5GGF3_ZINOF|nr:hypothetical protein ZIOFF_035156 [Zingiber officinale]
MTLYGQQEQEEGWHTIVEDDFYVAKADRRHTLCKAGGKGDPVSGESIGDEEDGNTTNPSSKDDEASLLGAHVQSHGARSNRVEHLRVPEFLAVALRFKSLHGVGDQRHGAQLWVVDKACNIFDAMPFPYDISLKIEHYTCMVQVQRCGRMLQEIDEFIEKMPIEPNCKAWGVLSNGTW